MERSQEFKDRLKLFTDQIAMNRTERIPVISDIVTWHILDCGYKLSEAMTDYSTMQKVVEEFHERYQFDAYIGVTARNPVRVTNALGGSFYVIDDEQERINYYDHIIMEGNEYGDFLKDPAAFRWKMFQRKYPGLTGAQLLGGIGEFLGYLQFSDQMIERFASVYSRPAIFNTNLTISIPFDVFFNNYRGIKETSIDIRKHKSEMKEAMDWIFENENMPTLQKVAETPNDSYICDTFLVLLGHTILNAQQWEELYWPYLKSSIDFVVEHDKTIYLFVEGGLMRFAEYFQDIPKGHVVMSLEQDDPVEMRKLLPNICFSGGMTSELLGYGTPEQCIDYAKRLIDGVGEGFIFGQDKMVSFRNECKRENLLAVTEYVKQFRC